MKQNRYKTPTLAQIYREVIKEWKGYGRLKEGLALYYWPQVAGKDLENKTEAHRVNNGILWIKCKDPSLSYNLNFFKREIIKKYREILGAGVIRSVRIVVGEIEEAPQKTEVKKEKREVAPPPEIKQIKDDKIRESFLNLYRSMNNKECL